MKDFLEYLEARTEIAYNEMLRPDGKLKCGCGNNFNPDEEGGPISPNPYSMSVCGECLNKFLKEINNPKYNY